MQHSLRYLTRKTISHLTFLNDNLNLHKTFVVYLSCFSHVVSNRIRIKHPNKETSCVQLLWKKKKKKKERKRIPAVISNRIPFLHKLSFGGTRFEWFSSGERICTNMRAYWLPFERLQLVWLFNDRRRGTLLLIAGSVAAISAYIYRRRELSDYIFTRVNLLRGVKEIGVAARSFYKSVACLVRLIGELPPALISPYRILINHRRCFAVF